MALNDMLKTLSDKVAVHLNLPFESETDLQLNSITAQMMVQIVDMTDNAILQEIIDFAKENKICDVYLLDKRFVKEALEKQIPRKIDSKDEDDFVCGCHNCGEVNALWKMNGDRNHYCGNCGQALDWSDTE